MNWDLNPGLPENKSDTLITELLGLWWQRSAGLMYILRPVVSSISDSVFTTYIIYAEYLEVNDVVFSFFLGQSLGCHLTGESHSHSQTTQQESYMLPTWVLEGAREGGRECGREGGRERERGRGRGREREREREGEGGWEGVWVGGREGGRGEERKRGGIGGERFFHVIRIYACVGY